MKTCNPGGSYSILAFGRTPDVGVLDVYGVITLLTFRCQVSHFGTSFMGCNVIWADWDLICNLQFFKNPLPFQEMKQNGSLSSNKSGNVSLISNVSKREAKKSVGGKKWGECMHVQKLAILTTAMLFKISYDHFMGYDSFVPIPCHVTVSHSSLRLERITYPRDAEKFHS